MTQPLYISDHERGLILRMALGRYGADWTGQTEHRFVHKDTGEVVAMLDARVHTHAEWRSEWRNVITSTWTEAR